MKGSYEALLLIQTLHTHICCVMHDKAIYETFHIWKTMFYGGSMKCIVGSVRIKRVQGLELFCQLFSLFLPAEPAGSYNLLFFGDSEMTDEDGEIVFNTQAEHTFILLYSLLYSLYLVFIYILSVRSHVNTQFSLRAAMYWLLNYLSYLSIYPSIHTPSEAVASGTLLDSSNTKMDAIMEALQSISSQNKRLELKIEQKDHKEDVQEQEISEHLKNLGACVNKQAAQMDSPLKLLGDKLAAKINVFEEEFLKFLKFLKCQAQILQRNC